MIRFRIVHKASKRPVARRRRKKGDIPRLKAQLWQICRQIKNQTTCYTCGRENLTGSNRQLGHYIASSLCSVEMRFCLDNVAVQCYNCNINKSGNTLQFQRNLIRDHGQEYVDELWNRNEQTKGKQYTKEYFTTQILTYQKIVDEEN